MAWSAPIIHAVGDILTASDWNISSNDISFLAGTAFASVSASQTTASTSFTDLATVGPTVTLTTGANALVHLQAQTTNTNGAYQYMGFTISGATTLAANTSNVLMSFAFTGTGITGAGAIIPVGSLTPGSNTFTAKYQTSTGTATFQDRFITVIPLP